MNHQAARAALAHARDWRRSSYSKAASDCVEITADIPGWVGVRDSKLGSHSPILAFTLPQWRTTLMAAQASEFNSHKQPARPRGDSSPNVGGLRFS